MARLTAWTRFAHIPFRIFDEDGRYLLTTMLTASEAVPGRAFNIIDPRWRPVVTLASLENPLISWPVDPHALTVQCVHLYGQSDPKPGEPWRWDLTKLGMDCQVVPYRTPIKPVEAFARLQGQYLEIGRAQAMHQHCEMEWLRAGRT